MHVVAQDVAADARMVYVDRDPIVRAHAARLLDGAPRGPYGVRGGGCPRLRLGPRRAGGHRHARSEPPGGPQPQRRPALLSRRPGSVRHRRASAERPGARFPPGVVPRHGGHRRRGHRPCGAGVRGFRHPGAGPPQGGGGALPRRPGDRPARPGGAAPLGRRRVGRGQQDHCGRVGRRGVLLRRDGPQAVSPSDLTGGPPA
ncbi:SAM-dependent methyltransferase [Streptomyces sp. TRM68367]|nr:SAM-dependent methyltransferase [Streptomyces sp. TRM68367]